MQLVNLRLAISNAVDRESLVNNFVMSGAKATYTAIPVDFAPNVEAQKLRDQTAFDVGFDAELFSVSTIARFTRNEMVEVLNSDYVKLAEAKGLYGFELVHRINE